MKTAKTLILSVAALVLGACAGSPSETTVIKGQFQNKSPEEVRITAGSSVDTTVVVDGKTHSFKVELPTNLFEVANIEAEDHSAMVVLDGTVLTVNFGDEGQVDIESDRPRISVQKRFEEYGDWMQKTMGEYRQKSAEIDRDPVLTDMERKDRKDQLVSEISDKIDLHAREVFTANKDNILALFALPNIDAKDAELKQMLLSLPEEVRAREDVSGYMEALEFRLQTGEGTMFKDFTIVQDPEDPEGSTVSLSDYVGKGKFILVDFWASWCGPCRAEMPNLKEVYERYHSDRFDMLSVAVWDRPEATKKAAEELGIEWNQIINAQKVPTEIYGIEGIPHIILFGPDGTVLERNLRGVEIGRAVDRALR